MKLHSAQQGSLDWLKARAGIPTASEFDNLVTPEFKIRTGQTPATYLALKVAEAWLGGPLADFKSFDMEQGNILEDEAIPWYELEFGQKIQRVGLITTDDGRVGCSPDGLIGEDNGIEIKCPAAQTHVRYLLEGVLPKDYAAQVHGAMWVTGYPRWTFLSYRRGFPALVLTVEREEGFQQRLTEALRKFLADFDEAIAKLVEINGGPPPRRQPAPEKPPFVSEMPS